MCEWVWVCVHAPPEISLAERKVNTFFTNLNHSSHELDLAVTFRCTVQCTTVQFELVCISQETTTKAHIDEIELFMY